jgi:hypothetical protein
MTFVCCTWILFCTESAIHFLLIKGFKRLYKGCQFRTLYEMKRLLVVPGYLFVPGSCCLFPPQKVHFAPLSWMTIENIIGKEAVAR